MAKQAGGAEKQWSAASPVWTCWTWHVDGMGPIAFVFYVFQGHPVQRPLCTPYEPTTNQSRQSKHLSRCFKSVECRATQVLSVSVWHSGKGQKICVPSKSPKVADEFLQAMTIEYLRCYGDRYRWMRLTSKVHPTYLRMFSKYLSSCRNWSYSKMTFSVCVTILGNHFCFKGALSTGASGRSRPSRDQFVLKSVPKVATVWMIHWSNKAW